MSDDKYIKDDPERTLITLDQLSQTIEVMTSVVNRLRRHLSEQIKGVTLIANQCCLRLIDYLLQVAHDIGTVVAVVVVRMGLRREGVELAPFCPRMVCLQNVILRLPTREGS